MQTSAHRLLVRSCFVGPSTVPIAEGSAKHVTTPHRRPDRPAARSSAGTRSTTAPGTTRPRSGGIRDRSAVRSRPTGIPHAGQGFLAALAKRPGSQLRPGRLTAKSQDSNRSGNAFPLVRDRCGANGRASPSEERSGPGVCTNMIPHSHSGVGARPIQVHRRRECRPPGAGTARRFSTRIGACPKRRTIPARERKDFAGGVKIEAS